MQFIKAVNNFESGQVYSVLTKDDIGQFKTLNKEKGVGVSTFAEKVVNQVDDTDQDKANEGAGYLIYIVTQEVLFNDEISTITYFKDITFGVLYEQIKLQNQL